MTCRGDCGKCVTEKVTKADGISIHQIVAPDGGMVIGQHAHTYDHITLIATGLAKLWQGDAVMGIYSAGETAFIPANQMHAFEIMEDGTTLYCIHNTSRTGKVQISAESGLPEGVESFDIQRVE